MTQDIYYQLRERIDEYALGFPTTESGVEIEILQRLFQEECTSCEACIERCPMDALTMTDGGLSLDTLRCIGCGLCSTGCPAGAISLVQKNPDKLRTLPPPEKAIFMKPSREFEEDIKRWQRGVNL